MTSFLLTESTFNGSRPVEPTIRQKDFRHHRRSLLAVGIVSACVAATWIGSVAVMSGRGLDLTDEGFYLLSYRWWHADTRTFTGAQYIYGPIFQALGYNIQLLRLVRLTTFVLTYLTLGWTFMSWLRTQRCHAPATRLWELAGTMTIVASGGVAYGWLPMSPGYNDVALLGSLLLAACVLRLARSAARGEGLRPLIPALMGSLAVLMCLAKWAAAIPVLGLVGAVSIAVLLPGGGRGVLVRAACWTATGAAGFVVLFQGLVMPWSQVLPPLIEVNRLVGEHTNSPLALLGLYFRSTVDLAARAITVASPALLVTLYTARGGQRFVRPAIAVSLTLSVVVVAESRGWRGGVNNLWAYTTALVAMTLIVLGAQLVGGRSRTDSSDHRRGPAVRGSGAPVVFMLVALPLAQSLGTGNPLFVGAVNGLVCWVALLVAVVARMERSTPLRFMANFATATAVLIGCSVGVDATLNEPYLTGGFRTSSVSAAQFPPIDSLRLPQREITRIAYLASRLRPYLHPSGRAILAYDEMPGLVLALGGRPVGEVWLSREDRARSAAGLRAACADGNPWGSRQPLLLFDRNVSATEIDALRSCGLSFSHDYRELPMNINLSGVRAYVPVNDSGDR